MTGDRKESIGEENTESIGHEKDSELAATLPEGKASRAAEDGKVSKYSRPTPPRGKGEEDEDDKAFSPDPTQRRPPTGIPGFASPPPPVSPWHPPVSPFPAPTNYSPMPWPAAPYSYHSPYYGPPGGGYYPPPPPYYPPPSPQPFDVPESYHPPSKLMTSDSKENEENHDSSGIPAPVTVKKEDVVRDGSKLEKSLPRPPPPRPMGPYGEYYPPPYYHHPYYPPPPHIPPPHHHHPHHPPGGYPQPLHPHHHHGQPRPPPPPPYGAAGPPPYPLSPVPYPPPRYYPYNHGHGGGGAGGHKETPMESAFLPPLESDPSGSRSKRPRVSIGDEKKEEEDEDQDDNTSDGGDDTTTNDLSAPSASVNEGETPARRRGKGEANMESSNNLSIYVRPKVVNEELVKRRQRKNSMSRLRAQRRREEVEIILTKPEWERTEEENKMVEKYEEHRSRKNDRSRARALENKREVETILAKPAEQRTKRELAFLETHLYRKERKNEGDRLRRMRMKALGVKGRPGIKVTARGPLPPEVQGAVPLDPANMPPQQPYPPYPYPPPPPHGYPGYPPYPGMPPHGGPHAGDGGRTGFTIANGRATSSAPSWDGPSHHASSSYENEGEDEDDNHHHYKSPVHGNHNNDGEDEEDDEPAAALEEPTKSSESAESPMVTA